MTNTVALYAKRLLISQLAFLSRALPKSFSKVSDGTVKLTSFSLYDSENNRLASGNIMPNVKCYSSPTFVKIRTTQMTLQIEQVTNG